MNKDGYEKIADDLDDLGRRIAARLKELKNTGRLPENFESTGNEIRARQQRLRDRVAEAIRSGNASDVAKAELARDYSSLFDNALAFEQRTDREFCREHA